MRTQIVDIIGDFIDSISFAFPVQAALFDGVNTALSFEDTLYLRKGMHITATDEAEAERLTIISDVLADGDIVVKGDYTALLGTHVYFQRPAYVHGTPVKVNVELGTLKNSEKTPLIYLYEVIRDRVIKNQDSPVDREPELALFYLDNSDPKWLTETHYTEVIDRMRSLAEYLEVKMDSYRLFISETIPYIDYFSHADFGRFVADKGHTNTIFDENFSGVEQRLTLPIKHSAECR